MTYSITYNLNGGVNDTSNPSTYTIETPEITLAAATKEGYRFDGWWDSATDGNQVTSIPIGSTGNKILYARYTDLTLVELSALLNDSTGRTRPAYTTSISEWDTYWSQFVTALNAASVSYGNLQGKDPLTPDEKLALTTAKQNLQRAVEILNGIEDFDAALGDRVSPKGLENYVNDRSRVQDPNFQSHRLMAYYDKETSDFYWLMSCFQQEQQFYAGTAGTGMNPGLKEVLKSETLIKVTSGEQVLEIYKPDGTRKTEAELENDILPMVNEWVDGKIFENYSFLAGKSESFNLVGKTGDGTEFQRSYTFHFVDSGIYLFDPYFDYYVDNEGAVLRDFRGFTIINATHDIGYNDSSIQAAINAANPGDTIYVAAGTYNESVTINKSITLIGDYGDERLMGPGPNAPILDGSSLTSVPGFQIASGVSDVTIKGFEITNYNSGGIVGQGAGINNVTIENNFIHTVGNDGVLGGTSGTQILTGWAVAHNMIAGSGVNLDNIGDLSIRNNQISNPAPGNGIAISVMSRADSNSIIVSGVTISNNDVNGAINVFARATGSLIATVENVNISNNTSYGAINIEALAEGSSNATVKGVSIDGNTISGNFAGIDLRKQGSGTTSLQNFTITGNNLTINNPKEDGCAVSLANVSGNSSLSKNTVTVTGAIGGSGSYFDGVDISGSATGSWTITGNTIDGNNVGTASSGIHLRSSLPATAALNMEGNTVTEWAQGISSEALVSGTAVELRRNWIFGNSGYGISNADNGATIDAILNYWGDASGPKHATLNSGGQGNQVSNKVDFDPWHQDEDFISLSDGTVHNETQDKYYHSIQTAVTEAEPGDVIFVAPGVYSEEIQITKSITLRGDCGDMDQPGPGPNAPILDGENVPSPFTEVGFQIRNADDVVIEGFEVRNYNGRGIDLASGVDPGGENVTFRYNYVHDLGGSGVHAYSFSGQSVNGWVVTHNIIERVATKWASGEGINFHNVGQSEISYNVIRDFPVLNQRVGIRVAAEMNVGQDPISGITISNNDIELGVNCLGFQCDNLSYDLTALRDITIENNILKTTGLMAGEGMAQISGTGVFKGNTVEVSGGEIGIQFFFWNSRTVEWTIENNDFVGINCQSAAIFHWDPDDKASVAFNMVNNTFAGFNSGVVHMGLCTAVFRSNCFMGEEALWSTRSVVDAKYNYWGHENGPFNATLNPSGLGGQVNDNVIFIPWYTDADCTIPSGEAGVQGAVDTMDMRDAVEALEPSITMSESDVTIEEGRITLTVKVENNGLALEEAIYGVTFYLPEVAEDIAAFSSSCNGETFELSRDGSDAFTGYFGLPDSFTIDEGYTAPVTFTFDLGDLVLIDELAATLDVWVGLLSAPGDAVAQMEQVQLAIPVAEVKEMA